MQRRHLPTNELSSNGLFCIIEMGADGDDNEREVDRLVHPVVLHIHAQESYANKVMRIQDDYNYTKAATRTVSVTGLK